MVVFEQCPNRSIVEQLVKMRKHLYDFPQRNLVPLLKWKKIFWQERLRQVERRAFQEADAQALQIF